MNSLLTIILSVFLVLTPKQEVIDSTLNYAVVSNNKVLWEKEINHLAAHKDSLDDFHKKKFIELIYGYIGWNIREGKKEESLKFVEYLNSLINSNQDVISIAEQSAYLAAVLGYKILLNKEDIIIGGVKCYNAAKKALDENPDLPLANIIMAKVTENMPSFLKNKHKEALKYYYKAVSIFENSNNTLNNWQYYETLNSIANIYKKMNKEKNLKNIIKKIDSLKKNIMNIDPMKNDTVIKVDTILFK
ncbi:MAG: hypothetical protein Q4F97_03050 [Bacteroidales bacterium]|nr:hypothetical protein [Bacteroidales bacterium]